MHQTGDGNSFDFHSVKQKLMHKLGNTAKMPGIVGHGIATSRKSNNSAKPGAALPRLVDPEFDIRHLQ
jgi:hypothetical protein